MMEVGKRPQDPAPETVACEVCFKEVPRSVAQSPEGTEYVYYFCGPDCYEHWRERKDRKKAPEKPG